MHWCAIHSFEEGAQILFDYVKENGGDSLRTTRLLDAVDRNGQSPLMLAANKRNGLFCKTLTKLGANPNLRDEKGHNAAYIARNAGWVELADWLEKKVGGGLANLETYSDLQYDKKVRYGSMKTKEFINEFCENYLTLIGGRGNSSPLGPPSIARQVIFS
jgi:ankyrin repeat protein